MVSTEPAAAHVTIIEDSSLEIENMADSANLQNIGSWLAFFATANVLTKLLAALGKQRLLRSLWPGATDRAP